MSAATKRTTRLCRVLVRLWIARLLLWLVRTLKLCWRYDDGKDGFRAPFRLLLRTYGSCCATPSSYRIQLSR